MAKRKRKAFRTGDCVTAPFEHGNSVGRVVGRNASLYRVKFFGMLRSAGFTRAELRRAACTRSTPGLGYVPKSGGSPQYTWKVGKRRRR